VNRHSFPSPYDLTFPQNLHDPQIRRGMASPSISCSRPHGIGFVSAPQPWPLLTQVAVLPSFAPIPNWLCSALFVALSHRRSACRARSWDKIPVWSFVGVPFDTLKILFHAPTQCQRWHQLVAFTFMAATPVHLAQANHRSLS